MAEHGDHDTYDAFAAGYAKDNEQNAWNAGYERPAALALLGDVTSLHVLDAGCGAGAHAAELLERGAQVTGIDRSSGMLALAEQQLGTDARLVRADLREPLPFDDDAFDAVLASLVMHYLRDWVPTLREFRRVLKPSGRLVFSTHHPFMDHALVQDKSYFDTYEISEDWSRGDIVVNVRFWHRPLRDMTAALRASGFTLDALDEPLPDPAVRGLDARAWHSLTTRPRFILFSARPQPPVPHA